jgi:hypothetical protein
MGLVKRFFLMGILKNTPEVTKMKKKAGKGW